MTTRTQTSADWCYAPGVTRLNPQQTGSCYDWQGRRRWLDPGARETTPRELWRRHTPPHPEVSRFRRCFDEGFPMRSCRERGIPEADAVFPVFFQL